MRIWPPTLDHWAQASPVMRSKFRGPVASPVIVHWKSLDPLKFSGTLMLHLKITHEHGITAETGSFETSFQSGDAQADDSSMAQVNGYAREQTPLSPPDTQRSNAGRVASITRTGKYRPVMIEGTFG